MKPSDADLRRAAVATGDELKSLVHHQSPEVVSRLIFNRNLTEELVLIIAARRNLPPDVLETLYHNGKWKEHYRVVQALSKNPKAPQKVSLALLKSLRIIDIADLTRNKHVPIAVRSKAELRINEKILTMPLGIKITIARRASRNVLLRLIEDGMREVVDVCLQSNSITEGDISNIVRMRRVSAGVIRQIAEHPKWSGRHDIQHALIRNRHTPLKHVVGYLEKIKTTDLKELYEDAEVPSCTKPFIRRELLDRGAIGIEATH